MTRARSGKTVLRGRKRMRKLTKGFRLSRHNLIRQSLVTLIRGRVYAFRDRRVRKRSFRRLWITRISAACRMRGLRYGQFINGLLRAQVPNSGTTVLVKAAGLNHPCDVGLGKESRQSGELWAESKRATAELPRQFPQHLSPADSLKCG